VSICMLGKPDHRPRLASENGWSSTTKSAHILPMAENHQPWSIGWNIKQRNPISRSEV